MKIAIVAALEREVRPLVKNWRVSRKQHDGQSFKFFENSEQVLVCGGIGAKSARRAAEAIVETYKPQILISAGFAGALNSAFEVGQNFTPRWVIDATDGSRIDTGCGEGRLVSFTDVADARQKTRLAAAYEADAVDMEAAAVWRCAEAHGIRFKAYKAISDASDSSLPPVARFVDQEGQFRTLEFTAYVALRPWLWGPVMKLARDSRKAAESLCKALAGESEIETKVVVNS